ncbi:MAG: peroxidase family protein [Acidimicrobiia bacterium]
MNMKELKEFLAGTYQAATEAVDQRIGWDRLPRPLGIAVFVGLRDRLRAKNLYDTGAVPAERSEPLPPEPPPYVRTTDGSWNNREAPAVGRVGCRFGRNVRPEETVPEKEDLLTPSPREVSRRLLTRDEFLPAKELNTLAAAWLQFEVHDWFSHGTPLTEDKWPIPLENEDRWWEDGRVEPMLIQRTRVEDPRDPDAEAPTYRSTETHWWDGSQVYGSTEQMAGALRTPDGRMTLDADGLPPAQLISAVDRADTGGAFWLGLGLFHTLFMQEHNAIWKCLWDEHRDKRSDGDWLYHHARLVNCALMAKIHATEWSPALIGHKTTKWGAKIEWYGLAGKWMSDHVGRLGSSELLSGIPGSPTRDHGCPFSLTEEFVAVYRMHQLIPDHYEFRRASDHALITEPDRPLTFPELGLDHAHARLKEFGMANSLYSFGVSHPGRVVLHNFPRFLQRFERPLRQKELDAGHEAVVDLGAIDILRNRERGVPRYNQFRERFHRRPVRSFEELTGDRVQAEELREVYRGDIDRLDLSIGLYAERFPEGFAFSDTAFRVFILMATRRLKSDRFFTVDYRPDIYMPAGMRWVQRETLATVLGRHYPELKPALRGVDNAFKPWEPARR